VGVRRRECRCRLWINFTPGSTARFSLLLTAPGGSNMTHLNRLSRFATPWLMGVALLAGPATGCSANGQGDTPVLVADDESFSADALSGSLPIGSTLRTTGNVNFRTGPSVSNGVIAVLAAGTEVVTVNRTTPDNGFWNVERQGEQGWVSGKYLGLVSSEGGGGVPAYATFHLNYSQTKDWTKCSQRDFVVFDMLDTPATDIAKCKGMGARMLCYFSSQYENWRADAGGFGKLGSALDGWAGERWVDPADPANLAVMMNRLDTAVSKGCDGIDLDNIDHAGHESYVMKIFSGAHARGLLVSQKNAPDKIGLFWDKVDMYQNEQCQQYDECGAYEGLGRPVYNIEYSACKVIPYLYSHRKNMDSMNAWEGACSQ
jgi:hypothetical protein